MSVQLITTHHYAIHIIGSVRKNCGGRRQAWYQSQVIKGKRWSLSALVQNLMYTCIVIITLIH